MGKIIEKIKNIFKRKPKGTAKPQEPKPRGEKPKEPKQ